MSGVIKRSRSGPRMGNRGDPGLFSSIGHALSGAVSGFIGSGFNPIGAVTGAIGGLTSSPRPPTMATMPTGGFAGGLPLPPGPASPGTGVVQTGGNGQLQRVKGVFGDVGQFQMSGGSYGVPFEATAVKGCPSGYHPNKSGYYRRLPNNGAVVYIPKGHVCVKNRRRNSLNPRALDRAIGRVEGAKRIQHKLSSITTAKFTAAGKRKDCGCGR